MFANDDLFDMTDDPFDERPTMTSDTHQEDWAAVPEEDTAALPFTVSTDVDLGSGATPWLRESGGDVAIRAGTVPTALPKVEREGVVWQYGAGRLLFRQPGGPRVLVEGGESVRYSKGAPLAETRLALLGLAIDSIALQRGLLPMHASAVAVGGNVYGLAGVAGKSTMAVALGDEYAFFADDSVFVDRLGPDGPVRCCAIGRRPKLLPRALEQTGARSLGSVRSDESFHKAFAEPSRASSHAVGELRALLVLRLRAVPKQQDAVRLLGAERLSDWWSAVHRIRVATAMIGHDGLLEAVRRVSEPVPTWSLHLPIVKSQSQFDRAVVATKDALLCAGASAA